MPIEIYIYIYCFPEDKPKRRKFYIWEISTIQSYHRYDPTVGCTTLTLSSIPQFHDKFPTNMFTSSRIVARTGARLPAGCTYSFIPRLHCSTPLFLSLSTGRSFRKCGYFLQNGRGVSTRMPFEHLHRSRITLACPLSADLSLTQP